MTGENLRFLTDEGCDLATVRALRAAGFDVLAVAEFMNRSVDSYLLSAPTGTTYPDDRRQRLLQYGSAAGTL